MCVLPSLSLNSSFNKHPMSIMGKFPYYALTILAFSLYPFITSLSFYLSAKTLQVAEDLKPIALIAWY